MEPDQDMPTGMVPENIRLGDITTHSEEDITMRCEMTYVVEEHPTASRAYGQGTTLMDHFHNDRFAHLCKAHPYYPFTSRDKWELASFLLRSNLSMSALDEFFKLSMVIVLFFLSKSLVLT